MKHKRVSGGDEIVNTESSKVNDGCQNHEKAFVNSDDDGSKRVKKKRRRVDCDLGNTAHKPKRKKKKSKEKIKTENREAEVKKSTKDPKDKRKKQKCSKSNEVIYEVSLTHESLQKELKRANMELASQATDIEELKHKLRERDEEISAMQLFIHLKERELKISIATKRLDQILFEDYEASSKGPGKWQKFSVFLQQSLEGPIDDLTKSKEYRERITKLQKEIFMSQFSLVEGFMRKKVSTRKTQRMNKEDRTKIALIKRLEELKHLKSVKKREFLFIDEENVHKLAVMSGVFDALVILICNSSLTSIFHMISAKPKTTLRFMELGLVNSTMEMFVDSENIISEKALLVLDTTCESNEGRTIVSGNKLVMLILLKISEFRKKNLISVMWKICKTGDGTEVEETLLLGVLKKFVVMLQVGCGEVTKECDEDDEKPDFNKKAELLGHPEDWDVFQGGDGLTPTRKEVIQSLVGDSSTLNEDKVMDMDEIREVFLANGIDMDAVDELPECSEGEVEEAMRELDRAGNEDIHEDEALVTAVDGKGTTDVEMAKQHGTRKRLFKPAAGTAVSTKMRMASVRASSRKRTGVKSGMRQGENSKQMDAKGTSNPKPGLPKP
ncbi:hypothetical protein Bca52824_053711 [Brassica carinata]|uniref:U-box domain-containing protein n=1 Tax=Brassica carinata TaxID=52824 RepID=A0A8X7R654_BRACI|nr:hypothetical protein Bca52824_053711 [Brassica carinata]